MAALGIDSFFTGLGLRATQPTGTIDWLTRAFIVKSFVPVIWLCFSLTYSRANYREFLTRWRFRWPLPLCCRSCRSPFARRLFQAIPAETPTDRVVARS